MTDLKALLDIYLDAVDAAFRERIWFIGLQGSYAREEATAASDIDIVLILDKVTPSDIEAYNAVLDTLPNRELICGFFSGQEELLSWEPSDLFQFYFDTKPIRGCLTCLLDQLEEAAVKRAIKIGAGNIYHGCVHNMLHKKDSGILRGLYKSAAFTVQAVYYLQTGLHIGRQTELVNHVSAAEKEILVTSLDLKNGGAVHFQEMSEKLFRWSRNWILKT